MKKARSFCVDANMYCVSDIDGAQYIEIMTLAKGKRVTVPLVGKGKISGNLRIVLNREKQAIEVHETAEVCQRWTAKPGTAEALDFGYTEVFTDTDGKQYGEGLGKIFSDFTDKLNHTIPARPGTGCTHSKRDTAKKGKYIRQTTYGSAISATRRRTR